jgi:hypothetical protein
MRLRTRVRLEVALASLSAGLFAVTLAYPEWIEALTGLAPDAGSGALELLVSTAFFAVAAVLGLLARRDRRKLALQRT